MLFDPPTWLLGRADGRLKRARRPCVYENADERGVAGGVGSLGGSPRRFSLMNSIACLRYVRPAAFARS